MRIAPEVSWPNLRIRRAEMLAGIVMHLISPMIEQHDEVDLRSVAYRKLVEFFATVGVDVVTDFERQAAGLPMRDLQGYAPEELHALEIYRRAAMLQPFAVQFPNHPPGSTKP